MESPSAFDLSAVDNKTLSGLIETLFSATPVSSRKVGKGFYADVFSIDLLKAPGTVIVKCHRHPGLARAEALQLAELGKHALAKVPHVFALALPSGGTHSDSMPSCSAPSDTLPSNSLYCAGFPCEALVMEHLPGVNASRVEFPDDDAKNAFVDSVVENLQAWHATCNENGFGVVGEPLLPTWEEAFGRKIGEWRQQMHADACKNTVSPYVLSIVDKSADSFSAIFRRAGARASLVHGDYNAWNMMVDPGTGKLTGIIDPIDAGWADSEIDLFHLPNSRPELGLLQRYLRDVQVDESFWMRYSFYRFWDDVKHFLRMGWYSEERFAKYAAELDMRMSQCL